MVIPPQPLSTSHLGVESEAEENSTEYGECPCYSQDQRAMTWDRHWRLGYAGKLATTINWNEYTLIRKKIEGMDYGLGVSRSLERKKNKKRR